MSNLFWDKEVKVGILWDDWFVCGRGIEGKEIQVVKLYVDLIIVYV
jgi:hypothetical protein